MLAAASIEASGFVYKTLGVLSVLYLIPFATLLSPIAIFFISYTSCAGALHTISVLVTDLAKHNFPAMITLSFSENP
jgi:hypothetical protein